MSNLDPGDFARNPEVDLFPELPRPQPPPSWPVTRVHLGAALEKALRESGVVLVLREDLVTVLAERDAFTEAEPALGAFKRLSAAAGVE